MKPRVVEFNGTGALVERRGAKPAAWVESPDSSGRWLTTPFTRTRPTAAGGIWPDVRQARRRARLDAIRSAVKGIGAPARATESATATLFGLSGADASWPLHDQYGLPLERIPDVIANTVPPREVTHNDEPAADGSQPQDVSVSASMSCDTASIRAKWVKAWGKFPRCSPEAASISSA